MMTKRITFCAATMLFLVALPSPALGEEIGRYPLNLRPNEWVSQFHIAEDGFPLVAAVSQEPLSTTFIRPGVGGEGARIRLDGFRLNVMKPLQRADRYFVSGVSGDRFDGKVIDLRGNEVVEVWTSQSLRPLLPPEAVLDVTSNGGRWAAAREIAGGFELLTGRTSEPDRRNTIKVEIQKRGYRGIVGDAFDLRLIETGDRTIAAVIARGSVYLIDPEGGTLVNSISESSPISDIAWDDEDQTIWAQSVSAWSAYSVSWRGGERDRPMVSRRANVDAISSSSRNLHAQRGRLILPRCQSGQCRVELRNGNRGTTEVVLPGASEQALIRSNKSGTLVGVLPAGPRSSELLVVGLPR